MSGTQLTALLQYNIATALEQVNIVVTHASARRDIILIGWDPPPSSEVHLLILLYMKNSTQVQKPVQLALKTQHLTTLVIPAVCTIIACL